MSLKIRNSTCVSLFCLDIRNELFTLFTCGFAIYLCLFLSYFALTKCFTPLSPLFAKPLRRQAEPAVPSQVITATSLNNKTLPSSRCVFYHRKTRYTVYVRISTNEVEVFLFRTHQQTYISQQLPLQVGRSASFLAMKSSIHGKSCRKPWLTFLRSSPCPRCFG